MNELMKHQTGVTSVVSTLTTLEALTFLMAALLHVGLTIPLGFVQLSEPQIIPAAIVEGLCGTFLAAAAYAAFTRRAAAWQLTLAAHAFALAGVALGTVALAVGAGPRTVGNDIYHGIMVFALGMGMFLLQWPSARGSSTSRKGPTNISH